MKNSVSDQSFCIESEEEGNDGKNDEEEQKLALENGYESDSSESSSIGSPDGNMPGSYNASWPRSYRYLLALRNF